MILFLVRFAVFALLFLFATGNCAAREVPSRIIVGGDHDFPPYEYLKDGKPTGFNIDLITQVAKAVDLQITIRLAPWRQIRQELLRGELDVISGMVYSEERNQTFGFTIPHTMITPTLFVRKKSPIHTLADIENMEIIVQQDDIMHEYLKNTSLTPRIIAVIDQPEAWRLFISGQHDGVMLASEVHKSFITGKSELDDFRAIKTSLPLQRYCFAVAKGDLALLHKLEIGLIHLKSTGEYQQIYDKWFGVYEQNKWWETFRYLLFAMALVAATLAVMFLWSWSLRKKVQKRTVELDNTTRELRESQAELEQRVMERTADLASTNDKLSSEILDRQTIEAALRKSEEEHRAIIDAFDGQIYICSADYRIEFMNNLLIERTGRDATGEPCYRVLHDRDSICPWCVNDRVMKGETIRWQIQSPKDNRWYYVVNTPINRDNGSISKQAMILDVTERVQVEEEKKRLEVRNLQLQKAESLSRMAGAIAHHFNNKLHVVTGYLEAEMLDLGPNDSPPQNLQAARQAAEKAAEVSRLMLIYLGQLSGKRTPVHLSKICRKWLTQVHGTLPESITLETDFLLPGPAVIANSNQIELLLSNLVNNSKEAIGEAEGTIHIAVKTVESTDILTFNRFPLNWQAVDKSYASLTVRDTGCGIAAEDIEEAFDPFFSTKFTGRGLGLSVVLGIAHAHGGAVTVESVPGRESIFRLFFPVADQKIPYMSEAIEDKADIQWSGSILLVDDDKIVLNITSLMLSKLGFDVITACDGLEAVKLFHRHRDTIRLVLSDFSMPRMNGLETLKALRLIDPDIPVVLASGYTEDQIVDGLHSEQPQAFLEKPYSFNTLSNAIRHSLT